MTEARASVKRERAGSAGECEAGVSVKRELVSRKRDSFQSIILVKILCTYFVGNFPLIYFCLVHYFADCD